MAEDLGHTVYKGPEGETTEWEDLQVKLGNFAPRPKPPKPPPFAPSKDDPKDPTAAAKRDPSSKATREWLDSRTAQELERLEDEGLGDDDRELERYRQRRLAQLRAAAAAPRFGALDELAPPAFVLQVTEASRRHWVVCHLYREGHPGCAVMDLCLMELAQKYPRTHFVRSPAAGVLKAKSGGGASAGVPDAHLPTLLLYRDGACKRHVAGMSAFGGERRVTPEQLALTLDVMGDGRVCSNVADEEEEREGGGGGGEEGGGGGGGSAASASATFAQRKREQEEMMLALAGQLARRGGLGGDGGGGGEEEEDDGVERGGAGRRAGGGGGGGVRRSTLARRAADSDESSDFD